MARSSKSGKQGGAPAKPRAKRAKPPEPPKAGGIADGKDSTWRGAGPPGPVPNEAAPAAPQPVVAPKIVGEAPAPEPIVPSAIRAAKVRTLNRPAKVAIGVGVVVVAAVAAAYVLAPHRAPMPATKTSTAKRPSRASCSLAPAQSFHIPAGTPSITFTIDTARACVSGEIPYEKTPGGFSRIILNGGAGVVSTLGISADLTTLQRKDFPLSPKEFASFHAALGSAKSLRCSPSDAPATAAAIRSRLATIRTLSQPYVSRQPSRQITWRCSVPPT
jgi:hypothetical protein